MPKAEVMGVGWTSDAHHFTAPNADTIIRAMKEAIDDAGLAPDLGRYGEGGFVHDGLLAKLTHDC